MSAFGWTGIRQAAHELHERRHVERIVLHVVADVVRPRTRHCAAAVVCACSCRLDEFEVDRLPLLEQLDGFVDARRHDRLSDDGR